MIRGKACSAFAVVSLALASSALLITPVSAALGDLTPKGCIDSDRSGPDACSQTAHGLDSTEGSVVSPDGKSVYVTGSEGDALVAFGRDTQSGALTPLGCVVDNDSGDTSCTQSTDGLNSPRGVAISEDGTSVYVASDGDDSIVWLARNLQTGALTPGGCVDDNDTGADGCAVSADGLKAAIAVAVSPDGKSVYVAGQGDDALVLFNRDSQTGALTPAGCIDDNDTGAETCAQTADGLDVPRDVVVSADGGSVYVVSQGDSAISAFGRDTQTGGLTPLGCIDDNDNGLDNCSQSVDGLGNARGVAVSPDGTSVYAAGQDDDALVAFGRDTGTGALTPAGCIDDNDTGSDTCAQSADGLDGIRGVVVSPDGRSVYVVAENDNSVTGFNRDQQSGALTFSQCVDDNDTSPETCSGSTDGLEHVFALSISPDGRSVYAQSEIDNAVVIFDRAGEAAPQTTITSGPKAKTGDRTPSFKFKSSEPGSTFECKLDSSTFASCTSPKTYGKQKFGKHTFQVRATGSNGEDDPTPAKRTWKIVK